MKKILLTAFVIVSNLLWSQKIQHPALLLTSERVNYAKKMMDSDPKLKEAWKIIKKQADEALSKNDLLKTDYLALAYLMSNDKKYAEKAKEILLNSVRGKQWSSTDEMMLRKPAWRADLGFSHKCRISAIAFDGIYNTLSEAERKEITEGLFNYGVVPGLGDWFLEPTRIHSLNSMGHNWWTSCASMSALLALSIANEVPQAATAAVKFYEQLPEWFAFAGDELQNKPKSFDKNGGMYESINYANFGISEALVYMLAWKNAYTNTKPLEIPELKNTPDFFMYCAYQGDNKIQSLNFGDSRAEITAENVMLLLYALGQKEDNMLWYLKQTETGNNREGLYRNTPLGFLYYPDTNKAPKEPNLKNSQLFADFGWATLRNSWKPDATMLAVKSGHTWNHSHADANSFLVYHKGENLIADGGHCWYPNPAYREYFFQSQAHNVVLFNGEGQPANQQYEGSMLDGKLTNLLDAGTIKYVLANATGPTSNNFIRNFRHFLWMDNIIYVVDDLKTYKEGNFEWLWHLEGEVKKSGVDINVKHNEAALTIRPIYPEYITPSNFVHDYPTFSRFEERKAPSEDLKGETTYYSVKSPVAARKIKGLTAIVLKEKETDKMPKIEKIEGKDWIGVRVHNNGKITDIIINQLADGTLMHSNSWIWAGGWETDAYMFAVTYDENSKPENVAEICIIYGSALRRNNKAYFGSLSKLNVIQKLERNTMSVTIDGQPLINVSFYTPKQLDTLLVNGEKTTFDLNSEYLSFKLDNRIKN
ncbi:heparinase II/III domain-containing protein [Flavobacterium phragmitis]|uniref:Heparinase II/III-like protein n=1 Tax=Flavobacterium phragmitis TaxID=739143 RepID=A0A1I1WPM1_9FLAO|nr:heparinase II/III family protein [Flavobacterium phragmitis]SFD96338.1 Heparinase II/III-like protein [Flavobacterium phragmitis]